MPVKVTVLVENTTEDPNLQPEMGLSIHIETPQHKVLFDLGPNDSYLDNAKKLGIDLTEVDTVVLSHGHDDHGGGLASFLDINQRAQVYLHRLAFRPHYAAHQSTYTYIGLDARLAANPRLVYVEDSLRIDAELFLFADVVGQFDTQSNRTLLKATADGYVQDDFWHEQSLIVTTADHIALFSGCSHRGITNILRTAAGYLLMPQTVFGGFHLYNPKDNVVEPIEVIEGLARALKRQDCQFFTCHCTGVAGYRLLLEGLPGQVHYLSTGTVLEL